MNPKFIFNNLKEKEKKKGYTLICCFSRINMVNFFFKELGKMKLPRRQIHLLIYDNTNNPALSTLIMQKLNRDGHKIINSYKSVRLFKSNLQGHGSIAGSGNEIFSESKLFNIWSMWKALYPMVFTDLFFQLEDDTIAPPNAWNRLFALLRNNPDSAMVTAISTGRQGTPWVPVRLGVHYMKVENMKILERHSLSPQTQGVVSVDGTGVYTFAARTKPFLSGFENYDPELLKVPFWALDNLFIYNIKQHGFKILADFDTWVLHCQDVPGGVLAFGKDQALEFSDLWIPSHNNYAQGVEKLSENHKPRRYQIEKFAPRIKVHKFWIRKKDGNKKIL